MSEFELAGLMFVVTWVVTFLPAWWLFIRLVALSSSPDKVSLQFWSLLVLYRLVIALPYIVLLIFGEDVVPDIIKGVIVGVLVAGTVFSVIRLYFREKLINGLWWAYGYFYDGLNHYAPYRRLVAEVMHLAVDEKPGATSVLELGCGTGNVLQKLSYAYPKASITGVDISSSMLQFARKKNPGTALIKKDAISFLREQSSEVYDLVVMQNVLYAIPERSELWLQLHKVLRPGGVVIVTNSDRAGSSSITREHLKYGKWYELLHPKLLAVGLIDAYISQLSKTGSFHFIKEEALREETKDLFTQSMSKRVYGGVNLLFSLKKK